MVTRSGNSQRIERPPTDQAILRVWRADRSISDTVAQLYLKWIASFRLYCGEVGLVEANELTHEGTERFQVWYVGSHKISAIPIGLAVTSAEFQGPAAPDIPSSLRALPRTAPIAARDVAQTR